MADTAVADQALTDRIARFVGYVEAIDSIDLMNVGSGGVSSRLVDYGFISYVESFADTTTTIVDGSTITMGGHLQIHLNDGSVISMDVTVSGNDDDDIIGLTDIRLTEARNA